MAGARVIMVNRRSEQGDDAIAAIKKESGSKAQIKWVGCDLGSLKQVKEVFTMMRENEERLDLVYPLPSPPQALIHAWIVTTD